jgi:hypothetical protein
MGKTLRAGYREGYRKNHEITSNYPRIFLGYVILRFYPSGGKPGCITTVILKNANAEETWFTDKFSLYSSDALSAVGLILKNRIELDNLVEDPMYTIVFMLEYVMTEPLNREERKVRSADEFRMSYLTPAPGIYRVYGYHLTGMHSSQERPCPTKLIPWPTSGISRVS